jgi:hypothetical protein
MLCNEFLATIEPSKVDAITLSRSNPQDNLEEVIVTKKKGIILPEKSKHLDRVYTLIYSENALYRGNTVINQPAILALPSQKNVKYVKRSKGNMTNKNSNRSYSTFVSHNHIIKKLIRSLV